jgi:hypothetical protein
MQTAKVIALSLAAALAFGALSLQPAYADKDKFGVKKLYATDDESWLMNDKDPMQDHDDHDNDSPFRFGTLKTIEELDDEGDGIWRLDVTTGSHKHGTRMHVYRPDDAEWKDVEMTGYFKVLKGSDQITLIARHGGSYTSDGGCDAVGYYAMVNMDGDAYFKKKLHHGSGGYSGHVAEEEDAMPDVKGRWVGLKFVVYNAGEDEVKLELYGDSGDEDNDWELLTEYTDDGDLKVKNDGDCGRSRDHVIDEAQPRVSYRVDDSVFEFKDLSVREIHR